MINGGYSNEKKKYFNNGRFPSSWWRISVCATMAYLTSKDSHVNTFTVGNVTVTQTEPHWSETDAHNKLVPGVVLTKDLPSQGKHQ